MKAIQPVDSDCESNCQETNVEQLPANPKNSMSKAMLLGLLGLAVWYVVYKQLEPFSYFFAYSLVGLKGAVILAEPSSFLFMTLQR